MKAKPVGKNGGFYIALTQRDGKIQKVGRTGRSFIERFRDARDKAQYQQWHFYLAPYAIGGVEAAIEHAIARALMRAGEAMPAHGEPRDVLRPVGTIAITKPLPPRLLAKLLDAYTTPSRAHATVKDKRQQNVYPVRHPAPANPSVLSLDPDQRWEVDGRSL